MDKKWKMDERRKDGWMDEKWMMRKREENLVGGS